MCVWMGVWIINFFFDFAIQNQQLPFWNLKINQLNIINKKFKDISFCRVRVLFIKQHFDGRFISSLVKIIWQVLHSTLPRPTLIIPSQICLITEKKNTISLLDLQSTSWEWYKWKNILWHKFHMFCKNLNARMVRNFTCFKFNFTPKVLW